MDLSTSNVSTSTKTQTWVRVPERRGGGGEKSLETSFAKIKPLALVSEDDLVLILALPFFTYVILSSQLSLSISFLICKMQIIVIPTSQGCCEDWVWKCFIFLWKKIKSQHWQLLMHCSFDLVDSGNRCILLVSAQIIGVSFFFFGFTKARSMSQSAQRKRVITEVLVLLLFPDMNCCIPYL